jgi:hypothetical protein
MDALENRLRRATRAAELWDDPIMVEARELIERQIVEKFKTAPLSDPEGLYKVRLLLHLSQLYETFFKNAVMDGQMAQHTLDQALGVGTHARR